MVHTISDLIRAAGSCVDKGPTFLDEQLRPDRWSFARVVAESARCASFLQDRGVHERDRVALILPDAKQFMTGFFGAILAGAIPVPLPLPVSPRVHRAYAERCQRMMRAAACRAALLPSALQDVLAIDERVWPDAPRCLTTEALAQHDSERYRPARPAPQDTCFLQFTSGSTSDPKGVVVTHQNLLANSKAIMLDGLGASREFDRGVSWLPLFHDMGLIGFVVAPLLLTGEVVFIPTLTFLRRPAVWMKTVHEHRGTITFGPNFSLGLAIKHTRDAAELDLSCLRALGCGAEPVNPRTLAAFCTHFAPAKLRPAALRPAYGLAEATLAVTFARRDQPYETLVIDKERYERERRAHPIAGERAQSAAGLELVSCGSALPGHEVEIHSETGAALPEGHVGEIVVRGPSCTPGYFGMALESNPVLHTGDLGFLHAGELYVSGRLKDAIIINGRNIYPQALEWEIEQVAGVREGGVAVFGAAGTHSEALVVAVEPSTAQCDALAQAIRTRLWDAFGMTAQEIVVVDRGAIPRTSSGKVQRARARSLWERKELRARGTAAQKESNP